MSRLTLRLPQTLHRQLNDIAESEGVSLNQYIVYALSKQTAQTYLVQPVSEASLRQQDAAFASLLQSLGKVSFAEIETALSGREVVSPEPELTPEVVAHLRARIAAKRQETLQD